MASIIAFLALGAVAGFVATRMLRMRTDAMTTILIGMLGALVGGTVLRLVFAVLGGLSGVIGAVIGALIVIWLWQVYLRR
ncbi:GlsB/YeaQ/YmgE family stress response membrane protein [Neotabrizicola shimadae]|uniref:GlsB/YeaQ/YmgE family stress response membrane protein n=1 Tax=Neotabrizicola shimadae TaxID=2807096 RepID=A0A8G0ZVN8_9RHOB|nr:GlsB/YeaQ/YmgE family stress response membrane protein [Neotabrizicola shimadae]QYZ69712.1 GlsB/YeaQ/YmgE family stress response membrane protein [Neotabrizicola shimadae]